MPAHSQLIREALNTTRRSETKQLAVLIDPDKTDPQALRALVELSMRARVDYFFIGGSLIVNNQLDSCLEQIRRYSDIPLVLFPGEFIINDG